MSDNAQDVRKNLELELKKIKEDVENINKHLLVGGLDIDNPEPRNKSEFITLIQRIQQIEENIRLLNKKAKLEASNDPRLNHIAKMIELELESLSNLIKPAKLNIEKTLKDIRKSEKDKIETQKVQSGEPPSKGFFERVFDNVARDVNSNEKEEILNLMRREQDLKILAEVHNRESQKGITGSTVNTAKRLGIGALKLTATATDSALSTAMKAVYTTALLPIVGPIKLVNAFLKKTSELNRPGRNPFFRAIGALGKLAYNIWPNTDRIAKENPVGFGIVTGVIGTLLWGIFIVGTLGIGAITLGSALGGAAIGVGAKIALDVKKDYQELRDCRMNSKDAARLMDARKQHPELCRDLQKIANDESVKMQDKFEIASVKPVDTAKGSIVHKTSVSSHRDSFTPRILSRGLVDKLESVQEDVKDVVERKRASENGEIAGNSTAAPPVLHSSMQQGSPSTGPLADPPSKTPTSDSKRRKTPL